ncbi:MAG: CDP-diacylglycerol--glycerol-3-phosphate 3-phosphatidyltransferase [Deltaproteobacteria bacterium]|nr:CDP-diacylglycerol--glycerol-3-phosphate 3-phosphatidyltransferase [Deltaproteobacteria bacterium]
MTKDIWNIPNILSLSRIAAAPLLTVILLNPTRYYSTIAAVIFSLAALTDWLDGYLARRMNITTVLGKFLDPLADKALIITSLIMLIPAGRVPAWMVSLIVGREIAVTGLRAVIAKEGIAISASALGKYKTTFQAAAVIALLIHYPFFDIDFQAIGMILVWLALGFTLWSGIDYFVKFLKEIGNTS